MEAFNSKASGARLLLTVFFALLAMGILSVSVSLAEFVVGCMQLVKLQRQQALSTIAFNYRGVAIATYLIVSGIFGCLFSCLAGCSCFRRRVTVSRLGRNNPGRSWRCPACCLYTTAGLGHVFSLAWLGAGFYWVYFCSDASDSLSVTSGSPLSSTTAAATATTAATVSSAATASAAGPLLWLRLTVCCLELAIVAAMLLLCNDLGVTVDLSESMEDGNNERYKNSTVDSKALKSLQKSGDVRELVAPLSETWRC